MRLGWCRRKRCLCVVVIKMKEIENHGQHETCLLRSGPGKFNQALNQVERLESVPSSLCSSKICCSI